MQPNMETEKVKLSCSSGGLSPEPFDYESLKFEHWGWCYVYKPMDGGNAALTFAKHRRRAVEGDKNSQVLMDKFRNYAVKKRIME